MTGENLSQEVQDDKWIEQRLARNEADLAEIVRHVKAIGGNPFELPPFGLSVTPGLVQLGEEVVLHFQATTPAPPKSVAQVQANFLGASPGRPRDLALDWRKAADGKHEAQVRLNLDQPGNWRVIWNVGGHRMTRCFGVAQPGKPVVTLWVGMDMLNIDKEIHKFDIPGDNTDIGYSPFGCTPAETIRRLTPCVRSAWKYGDRSVPFICAPFLLPVIRNGNVFRLSEAVQRKGLEQVRQAWAALGLNMDMIATYTPGHVTVKILKEMGIGTVTSFCVWQNAHDGVVVSDAWKINHVGMPNAPYYVADDDFRKAASGRSDLIAFTMGTASNIRMYVGDGYDGCPSNCNPGQRQCPTNNAVEANVDRFHTVVDGWISSAACNEGPLFVTVALENWLLSPHWRVANRQAVEYLVRRAGEDRLVFASAADVADYYRRHCPRQPQQVLFQHDYACGMRADLKPARLNDRIEMSNHRFNSVHVDGQSLPQLLWDYTAPWSNPEWDDQEDLRDKTRLIVPERIAATVAPLASIPKQADLRGARADVKMEPAPDGVRVRISLTLSQPVASLPLAVWRVPCSMGILPMSWPFPAVSSVAQPPSAVSCCSLAVDAEEQEKKQKEETKTQPRAAVPQQQQQKQDTGKMAVEHMGETPMPQVPAQFQIVRDGWTGNTHVVAVLHDVPAGKQEIVFDLRGPARKPASMDFESPGGAVVGRMFRTLEGTRTYLWRQDGVAACKLPIDVPRGCGARVRYNDGTETFPDGAGRIWVHLDDKWRRESPCLLGAEVEAFGGQARLGQAVPLPRTPFARNWCVSALQPGAGKLEKLSYPADLAALGFAPERMSSNWTHLYTAPRKRAGDDLIYAACRFECGQAMELNALLGYDGPIRVWVDGREILYDPDGTNWADIDSARAPFHAAAGEHELLVALGSNCSKAYGLYLRLERTDLTLAQSSGQEPCALPDWR